MNINCKIIDRKVTSKKRSFFTLKEVCKFMGHEHVLVVEKLGIDKVDCMSRPVAITDFCLKKFKDSKKLARGIIDPITGDAVCEMAENVKIKLECDDRDRKFCTGRKKGCLALKKIFAVNLEMTHSSVLENHLNCYYSYSDLSVDKLKKL